MPRHVTTLGVRVENGVLLPVAEASVLPLLEHDGPVVTRGHRVEHDVRVVAVRGDLGTQAIGSGNDAHVVTGDGTGSRAGNGLASLCDPVVGRELSILAQVLVVGGRRVLTKLELQDVGRSTLEPDTPERGLAALGRRLDDVPVVGGAGIGSLTRDALGRQGLEVAALVLQDEERSLDPR